MEALNCIYIYDGPFQKGEAGWPLIKEAAGRYAEEAKITLTRSEKMPEILRDEKGKPYFVDVPIEFSLTHSGLLWMCLFSTVPCGLDLQQMKECNCEALAKRQYTEEEQHYVELWGEDGFFDIWVRKEAFCKCTGQGIFSKMPSVVNEDGNLSEEVQWQGKHYYFTEIFIAEELKCTLCAEEKINIELRILG